MLAHLGSVPVREEAVRAEILVHFDEMKFRASVLFPRRSHPTCNRKRSRAPRRSSPPRSRGGGPESPTWDSIPDWPPAARSAMRRHRAPGKRKQPRPEAFASGAGSLYHCAKVSGPESGMRPLKSTMRSADPLKQCRYEFKRGLMRCGEKATLRRSSATASTENVLARRFAPSAQSGEKVPSGSVTLGRGSRKIKMSGFRIFGAAEGVGPIRILRSPLPRLRRPFAGLHGGISSTLF